MSRKLSVLLLVVSLLLAGAVGTLAAEQVLKIGATPVPHAEILEFIKPLLAARGIKLEIIEFTDYVTPNLALADGSIDLNFFQHTPYLNQFKADHNLELVSVLKVHVEPFGLYSTKINSLEQLAEGATIALPNDPSNEGRALLLLANHGLIELTAEDELKATPLDITKNPKKLRFKELEAAQLPRVLPDVSAAFINTNYALEAGLNPLADALIIEGNESPYANILVVRAEDQERPVLQELITVITGDNVRQFILDKYQGAVVPVF